MSRSKSNNMSGAGPVDLFQIMKAARAGGRNDGKDEPRHIKA